MRKESLKSKSIFVGEANSPNDGLGSIAAYCTAQRDRPLFLLLSRWAQIGNKTTGWLVLGCKADLAQGAALGEERTLTLNSPARIFTSAGMTSYV